MIAAITTAGIAAVVAHKLGLLTLSGTIAAALTGAVSLYAGPSWAILLLFFFATSTGLSLWRAVDRDRLLRPWIDKEGPRDAMQVIANGGLFAGAAFMSTRGDVTTWQAVGAGALAAMTADTWATEVGTVLGGIPRSIVSARQVAPGTSGGITIAGWSAALAGAVGLAVVAVLVGWSVPAIAVVAGGLSGCLTDSVLGATVQERRWCDRCTSGTERRIHSCGTTTVRRGGIQGCNNDVVNLLSTIAGAVVTWTLV